MSSYDALIDELQEELSNEKATCYELAHRNEENEKFIEEIQEELKKEKEYSARLEKRIEQYETSIEAIYNKQKRDRANTEVVFAVEHDLGEIDHEGPSYEAAKRAAEFYDDAIVVTRSVMMTDWQEVTSA